MTIQEKKALVREHPLFREVKEEVIKFIVEDAQVKTYPPQSFIIKQGEQATALYLINKGLIKIYLVNEEGKQIPIKTSGKEDFVGDLGIIDGEPIPATVEAIQETSVLILTKAVFLHALNVDPHLALNLLTSWAKKVREINKQRENASSLKLKERTYATLQTIAPHFPNKEVTLSQEELALIVGASRSRITEVLQNLEEEKYISHTNRKIILL